MTPATGIAGDFRGPQIAGLRSRLQQVRTHEQLRAWLDDALAAGIDPL